MQVISVSLNKIVLSKNSRLLISDSDLSELMASMKSNGLLQPIGVSKIDKGGYRIVYGNRRFLAASKLGWHKIDAILVESKDKYDADIKNLTENIQRRNISLSEAGRYMDILSKEGLTSKEIAARLGVSNGYIISCFRAYREVPPKFRDALEVRVSAKKADPGKITIRTAQEIINAQKTYGLKQPEVVKLFEAAKSSDQFKPDSVPKYALAIKSGVKDFLNETATIKSMKIQFNISTKEYDRLYKEFIENGPFNSMNALFIAIIEGKKSIKVKVE